MNLQKSILDQYLEITGEKSFRDIARNTGIQLTRVFRIFNGSKMRVDEYETFKKLIAEHLEKEFVLETLAKECIERLSVSAVKELENILRRKIFLSDLLKKNATVINLQA